jgi:hypothetical protein
MKEKYAHSHTHKIETGNWKESHLLGRLLPYFWNLIILTVTGNQPDRGREMISKRWEREQGKGGKSLETR